MLLLYGLYGLLYGIVTHLGVHQFLLRKLIVYVLGGFGWRTWDESGFKIIVWMQREMDIAIRRIYDDTYMQELNDGKPSCMQTYTIQFVTRRDLLLKKTAPVNSIARNFSCIFLYKHLSATYSYILCISRPTMFFSVVWPSQGTDRILRSLLNCHPTNLSPYDE